MTRIDYLEPVFAEFIPAQSDLESGKLYVSMTYATTVHLCASGCGHKVVLPLSPAQYRLQFDGTSISLSPSIGNWDYTCQAHYWIRDNEIVWAPKWSKERIELGRVRDEHDIAASHQRPTTPATHDRKSVFGVFMHWVRPRR